jgi:exodeoxyribonuclease VII small subunit
MNAKRDKSEKVDATSVPYTEAIRELDEILAEIERADVDLDRLAGRVERASELVKLLKARIRETEVKVTRIVEELQEEASPSGAAGALDSTPFDPDADAGSPEDPDDVPF